MFPARSFLILVLSGSFLLIAGCRSTSKTFSMNSDSGMPWFGLNFALPRKNSGRKTLETISDRSPGDQTISSADLREPVENPPPRRFLPEWLTGRNDASIPLPQGSLHADDEQIVQLEGPQEDFP